MDATDKPPEIVIVQTRRHDVREEAIERVARQLCEAEGCDPDENIQCSVPVGSVVMCTFLALPYPTNLRWYAYRDRARQMLEKAFR